MRKFTKSILALALLVLGAQGVKAQDDEPFYSIDYSTYESFPFFVMGFTPDWVNGIMTDQNSEGWHQYFIADGMKTEENGSYLVKAMVRASETVTFNINMGWGWGNGQQIGANVTIPQATEFQEVTWQYDGVGAPAPDGNTNLVAQPWKGGVTIEWKSLQVFKVDPPKDPVWTDLLINGDLEGESTECFYETEVGVGGPFLAKIYDGVGVNGSKGLMVQSGERINTGEKDDNGNDIYTGTDWETQFFIRFPYILPEGTKFKVSFDYKASQIATASTQAHANPGAYQHWACIGDVNFATDWQTFEKTVTVDAAMAKGDNGNGSGIGMQTIAFNLALQKTATQYFFDNIKVEVDEEILSTLTLNPNENAVPYPEPDPVNIEISPADGDISAALAAAEEGVQKIGDIYINLAEGGTYTISSSIVGPANIVVIGSNSTIDASSLDGPFIALANVENPTEWTNLSVGIGGVNIKGLSKPLFSSTCKNYLIEEFMVINSVVEVAGDVTVFDFTKGSAVHHFTMGGNTFYAPTATEKAFYSSQSGQKITECADGLTQGFDIQQNTFYNLTKSKNFFTHRSNSQTWLKFDVEDNIFVNCGKKGQTIKGINGGGSSANPVWTVKGNLFNFEGADTSAEESTGDDEEPIQDSVAGVANFDAPEAGDFNCVVVLAEGLEAPEKQPGDPRWRLVWQQTAAPVSSGEVLYALAEGDTFTSGQVVEVLYDETGAKAGDVVATIQYGEAGEDYADFKAAKADGQVEGFTAFTEGNGTNGNKAGGTFYTIVPKYDGVISAGVVLNGGKAFHLTVDGVQNPVFDGNTVTNKYYGTFSFNVEAGKSYKFWCDGSKLGFYGFNYVWGPDVEPITELPLNDETVGIATVNTAKQQGVYYNLQGVRVAQPTKGLYIINGKKVVVK